MKRYIFCCTMEYFPDEIILLIFKHASGYDLTTSFQMVCTRWNHLINKTESIWKGDVKLKGISEFRCKNDLLRVLKETPKLKYLQIGNPRSVLNSSPDEDSEERTKDILQTITVYNKELQYLHMIDSFPLCDSIRTIIDRPKLKRLSLTLDRLHDRRAKINRLKQIFAGLPNVDDRDVDFRQRINFICRKRFSEWEITEDYESYSSEDFD